MRIFITTDLAKLKASVLPKEREDNKGIQHLSQTIPILYFNSYTDEFVTESIPNSQIILIHDITYKESIQLFEINPDSDYLLHHHIPEKENYTEFKNKVEGQHERHNNKYPPVFKVLFDGPIENKVEKIKNILFKEANAAFKDASKIITLSHLLKERDENDNTFKEKLKEVNKELEVVKAHFSTDNNLYVKIEHLINEADPDKKIKAFQNLSSDIQNAFHKETKS